MLTEELDRMMREIYHITDAPLLQKLGEISSLVTFAAGSDIQAAGEMQENLYLLTDGIVRVFYVSGKGAEMTDCFLTHFGYPVMTPDLNIPCFMTSRAVTRTSVIAIPLPDILSLMEHYSQLLWAYNHMLTFSLLFHWQIKSARACFDARERYVWFRKTFPGVDGQAKGRHIASFLQITPETLSRLRRQYVEPDFLPVMVQSWKQLSSDVLSQAMSNGFRNNGNGADRIEDFWGEDREN